MVLLFLAMLFVRHNAILCNEISNILRMLRIDNVEILLSSIIMPTKALIFVLSQIVSLMCVFEVFFAISMVAIVWMLFVIIKEIAMVEKKQNKNINISDEVLSGRMTYREIQRFLC